MLETKEQIRTELINEIDGLIRKHLDDFTRTEYIDSERYCDGVDFSLAIINSLLPPETPEKIAERKAKVMMLNNGWVVGKGDYDNTLAMLIEALLTDIKK